MSAPDPQIAGLAIMGAGLLWFLRRTEIDLSPTPALLLMVVAGFWKHNNVAIPLAALVWLYVDRSQYACLAMRMIVEAVVVALAACVVAFGPNFIPDLLASRHYGLENVLGQVGHLQWSALALAIWAAWAVYDRSAPAKFTALHIGLALLTCLAQWFGHGVFGNAEFDLILALAIGLGVAFERIKRVRYRDAIIVALLLRLFLTDRQETALLLFSPEFRESMYASERNLLTQAKAVAAVPGDAACFIKLVCRQAGKPFVVDDFKTDELLATGKATPADIAALLDARGIRWIPKSLPTGPDASTSFVRWWRS